MELPTNTPVLLLRVDSSDTHVPIWIGAPEAAAIALMADDVDAPRPLTHDLVLNIIKASHRELTRIEITTLANSVFEAELVLDDETRVSARSSDAVAIALRAHVDIFVADDVVAEAGIAVPDEAEDEVEKFREFLDHVSADDFDEPEA